MFLFFPTYSIPFSSIPDPSLVAETMLGRLTSGAVRSIATRQALVMQRPVAFVSFMGRSMATSSSGSSSASQENEALPFDSLEKYPELPKHKAVVDKVTPKEYIFRHDEHGKVKKVLVVEEDAYPKDDPFEIPAVENLRPAFRKSGEEEMLRHRQQLLDEEEVPSVVNVEAEKFIDSIEALYRPIGLSGSTPRIRVRALDEFGRSFGRGTRKSAKAYVWAKPGTGKFIVNKIPMTEYFRDMIDRQNITLPIFITGLVGQFDFYAYVRGGGITGQSQALQLAIANSIQEFDPQFRPVLKSSHLLSRDMRKVERKKTGQKKARKRFAWVKR